MEKLLQHLVAETQSRPPPVVSPPLGTTASEAANSAATLQTGLEWCRLFFMRKVWMSRFRLCCQDGGLNRHRGVLL